MINILNAKLKYGKRYVPKATRQQFIRYILSYTGYECASIFNPYVVNFFYWTQTYISIKSGLYKFTHNTTIEIVWTIIPSLILVFIGIPSFILLYAMDEIIEPDFIIKCIGHQWYWSYEVEYPEISKIYTAEAEKYKNNFDSFIEDVFGINNLEEIQTMEDFDLVFDNEQSLIKSNYNIYRNFSSYMINEDDLSKGKLRLLEVDNPLYIPEKTHIDLLITANDVLHSWTIPSFGIKCDAVPGRLNHANLFVERTGIFYGQCSEICGVNHGFMPIKMIVENYENFIQRI
jgi:cytochrome c oxidase subunit 2